jgi:hypothetical protein
MSELCAKEVGHIACEATEMMLSKFWKDNCVNCMINCC